MKILTLVRQVPDAETTLRASNGRIDLSQTELQLDTMDEYGVEQALRLREAGPETNTEIVALAVGPASAEKALRSALALGADRAIHVLTPDASDVFLDPIALSAVVAQVATAEAIDLIFLGGRQADWDSEALGPAIAQRLDWPQLTWTTELTLTGRQLTGRHDIHDGSEAFAVPLPAVVTTQQGLNEPRYPTLPNIMKARKKDLRTDAIEPYQAQPLTRIVASELPSRARLRNIARAATDPAAAVTTFAQVLRKEAQVRA